MCLSPTDAHVMRAVYRIVCVVLTLAVTSSDESSIVCVVLTLAVMSSDESSVAVCLHCIS